MHVGFLLPGSLETTTGGYLYDRQLIQALRDRDVTVTTVIAPADRSYRHRLLDNIRLRRRLTPAHFDIMLHDELAHPSAVAITRSTDTVPIISLVHLLRTDEPRHWMDRLLTGSLERYYLRSVDGFIHNSQTTKRAVESVVDDAPSVVAYPGTDHFGPPVPTDTIPRRTTTDPFRIVFVGTIIPRKGPDTLVAALAELDGNWECTIVGDRTVNPSFSRTLAAMVDSYPHADRIQLTGRISHSTLRTVLADAHVLAVPSRYEAYGIVYTEAMAVGTVPLASTAGAGPELLADGRAGLLVPPDDPTALAGALQSVLDDRDHLATLAVAARERYDDLPTWEDTATTIHIFMEELIR